MNEMFHNAPNFNQTLNNWNINNVKNMAYMFSHAIRFNQSLNK
jgi:hypothetical protein